MNVDKLSSIVSAGFITEYINLINEFNLNLKKKFEKEKKVDFVQTYFEFFKWKWIENKFKNMNILFLWRAWIGKSQVISTIAKFIQDYFLYWQDACNNDNLNYRNFKVLIENYIFSLNKEDLESRKKTWVEVKEEVQKYLDYIWIKKSKNNWILYILSKNLNKLDNLSTFYKFIKFNETSDINYMDNLDIGEEKDIKKELEEYFKQISKSNNRYNSNWLKEFLFFFKDVRGSFYTKLDFITTLINKNNNKLVNYSNLELIPYKKFHCLWILFFDEISQVETDVQRVLYKIILERKVIDKHILPEGTTIIASGNLQDEADLETMDLPLLDRFYLKWSLGDNIQEVINNIKEESLMYFKSKEETRFVYSYLMLNPNLIYFYENEDLITPRKWEIVWKITYKFLNKIKNLYVKNEFVLELIKKEFKKQIYLFLPEKIANSYYLFVSDLFNSSIFDFLENKNDKLDIFKWKSKEIQKDILNYIWSYIQILIQEQIQNIFFNEETINNIDPVIWLILDNKINYQDFKIKTNVKIKEIIKQVKGEKDSLNKIKIMLWKFSPKNLDKKEIEVWFQQGVMFIPSFDNIELTLSEFDFKELNQKVKILKNKNLDKETLKNIVITLFVYLIYKNKQLNTILNNLNLAIWQLSEEERNDFVNTHLEELEHIYNSVFNWYIDIVDYFIKKFYNKEVYKIFKEYIKSNEFNEYVAKFWLWTFSLLGAKNNKRINNLLDF